MNPMPTKLFYNFYQFLGVSFLFLLLIACSSDDSTDELPAPTANMATLISSDTNLSVLLNALQRADLLSNLESAQPITVLAPTNEAFSTFLNENGFANLEDVPVEALRQLLLHHVLQGRFASTDFIGFKTGYTNSLADGINSVKTIDLFFNADQGVDITGTPVITFNGGAKVITNGANKPASNGILHVVDAVINFASVADFIVLDENLAAMEAALKMNGQPDFISLLSAPATGDQSPFTVFVPLNSAFLLVSATISETELTSVLNHHIIPNSNLISQNITNNLVSPPTLEGDMVRFSVSGSSISLTDGVGNPNIDLVVVNLQAINGIIHVTNRVLIPNMGN